MRRHLAPLVCIVPLVIFLMSVLVYPFVDMMYQGGLPHNDILQAGNADEVAARDLGWQHLSLKNYTAIFSIHFFVELYS